MKKLLIGSSPRTTLTGYAECIVAASIPVFLMPNFSWKTKGALLLAAILRAVYARLSKDSDGITRQQDVTVAKTATDGAIPPENIN